MEKVSAFVIFGPPGSGKGTQSALLQQVASFFHLSTGEMLRQMPDNTEEMRKFRKIIEAGDYLPDDAIMKIFFAYLQQCAEKGEFDPSRQMLLLDGMPRTRAQVDLLNQHVSLQGVIALDVENDQELFTRIKKRAEVSGRGDDASPEVLKRRLEVYREKTEPVLEALQTVPIYRVNALQKPLEVLRDILKGAASDLPFNLS